MRTPAVAVALLMTLAILGWRSMSLLMDSEAFPLATSSSSFPTKMKVIMTTDVSKYTSPVNLGKNVTRVLYPQAAEVPMAIKVSMFAVLCLSES